MPDSATDEISINGTRYAIVAQSLMPSGQRALVRNPARATNVTDPGRLRRVEYAISGPVGASNESTSGRLGIDYCQNLDTRFPKRLISAGARNAVSLAAVAPPGTGSALFGAFFFGSTSSTFGAPVTSGGVVAFDEQLGYLFVHVGSTTTQVGPLATAWTPIASKIHGAQVRDAASWFAKGRVALGATVSMQTRTAVSTTGATYAATTSTSPSATVYANALASGSDRCWVTQADPAGTTNNLVTFTLDDFVTMASAFQVGDPKVGSTGIGPFGALTFFGSYAGLFTFTDQGKPIPISRALLGHYSPNNGRQWADPGWGWNYALTDIGLRAVNGYIDNPVGLGEAMREFTGHNGRPTAVWSERGELFIAYLTTAGDTYLYRCTFSTSQTQGSYGARTGATGQFDMYPLHYLAATECDAGFSTNTPTNPAIIWGEGTNIAYETIARDGRDDLFTARVYSTGGGVAYLTTLDRDLLLLKNLRLARVRTKGLTSGSSWTVACSFDDGAYINIGAAITANGVADVRPVTATIPLTTTNGRAIKPRLTQVAAGAGASATPPEIAGFEIEYDERPETIEEATVTINVTGTNMSNNLVIANLTALVSSNTAGPVAIQMPDDIPPVGSTEQRYAMVAGVQNRHDIKDKNGEGIEAVDVILHFWPIS